MNKIADEKRDRAITREIHRLFWRANWQDPFNLIFSYISRMTAIAAYNVFIPLVTAYAIQQSSIKISTEWHFMHGLPWH